MDYVPHTEPEAKEMLQTLGLDSYASLFHMIPDSLKNPSIGFPPPLPEWETTQWMNQAASMNAGSAKAVFLGGGCYDHFIPQAVNAIASRGDFATAYTPYQAEASQGTLQAIFEFQTLLCRLTGMDVANASMYEGATSLAEAALMACRITRKDKIVFSSAINPHYRRVLQTYLDTPGFELIELPLQNGVTDIDALKAAVDDETAGVFLQHPNYFGCLEPVEEVGEWMKDRSALFGAVVYPHSLGLLNPPGSWNADLVIGDLQSIGLPMAFGGPSAGFVATKTKHMRQLPGRLCGQTTDADGKTGYVLTLQTREQQIRRAKATSNICTNQALCALAVTIYLCLMGSKGLRQAAEKSARNAYSLKDKLTSLPGVSLCFDRPHFNEFALRLPVAVPDFISAADASGILAGIPVTVENDDALLVCTTEKTSPKDIENYTSTLKSLL